MGGSEAKSHLPNFEHRRRTSEASTKSDSQTRFNINGVRSFESLEMQVLLGTSEAQKRVRTSREKQEESRAELQRAPGWPGRGETSAADDY